MERNEIEKGGTGQFIRVHVGDNVTFTFADGCFDEMSLGEHDDVVSYLDAHEQLVQEGIGWWMFEPDPETRGRYSPELAADIIEGIVECMGYDLQDITYVEGVDFKHQSGVLSWDEVESGGPPESKYDRTGVTNAEQKLKAVFTHIAKRTADAEELPSPLPTATFYDRDGEVPYALSPYIHSVTEPDDEQRERIAEFVAQDEYLELEDDGGRTVMIRHMGPRFEDASRWLEVFQFLRNEVLSIRDDEITYAVVRTEGDDETLEWDELRI